MTGIAGTASKAQIRFSLSEPILRALSHRCLACYRLRQIQQAVATNPKYSRCQKGMASPRLDPRASAERFNEIARQPFLVVWRCAGGIGECFFLGGEKRFEAILIDRFHEGFMR